MTSTRGHKIHVRKKAEVDEGKRVLEELYDSSEFGNKVSKAENKSPKKPKDDELTDEYSDNADIDDFLDAENRSLDDIVAVKEKESSKKARAKKAKIKETGHKLRNALLLIFLLLILSSGGTFLAMTLMTQNNSDESTDLENTTTEADKIYYSRLTGLQITNDEDTKGPAICVMVENSLDARNQSGLSQAGLVYEAVAEGGITRFMAVYQDTKPALIGPVRSIRLVYAHLAKQYNCSIAHVGGAQNALDLIRYKANGYRDIDQFFTREGDYYWRANQRPNGEYIYAPHNVYTSFNHLSSLSFSKGYNSSEFTGFSHVDPDVTSPVAEAPTNNITVNMGNNEDYNAYFKYDALNNNYVRWHWTYQSGFSIHYDLTGTETKPITPKVVIAMRANTHIRDVNGYFDYEVNAGQNDAYIFQNGEVIPAQWKRNSENDPLKFYDGNNEEIKLERGQVWISVYPANTGSVNWD